MSAPDFVYTRLGTSSVALPWFINPFSTASQNVSGTAWTRPADWISIPQTSSNEQVFYGVHAVYNNTNNFLAMRFSGSYIVDWGDGSALETYTSNTTCYHTYSFSAVSSSTLTSEGFRQVLVKVVPSGSNDLGLINLNQKHTQAGLQVHSSGWLDIAINSPKLSSLIIGLVGGANVFHGNLQKATIGQVGNLTSVSQLFASCYKLRSINRFDTSNATIFSYFLGSCTNLQTQDLPVPFYDTGKGTTFNYMFSNCVSLTDAPTMNTVSGTNFDAMFYNCYSLKSVPWFDTSNGTTFGTTFLNCYALQKLPALNLSKATTLVSFLQGCTSLQTIPQLDTSNCANFSYMFYFCGAKVIPYLNTSKGTNFAFMFAYSPIYSVPPIDTSKGTNFSTMFRNCSNIQSIPSSINTVSGTTFTEMFRDCTSLRYIPSLSTSNGTAFNGMFYNCTALKEAPAMDVSKGTNFQAIFGLCSALINPPPVLNTVSGTNFREFFNSCNSLSSVPLLSSSNVTNFQAMFQNCLSLKEIPQYDTSKGTNFVSMFENCYSLERIPALNTVSGTLFTSMFRNCFNLQTISNLSASSATAASDFTNMFNGCASLSSGSLIGPKYSHSYSGCKLSTVELVNIFNNLPSVTGQTLTITNNWGAPLLSAAEKAIATGKGWTLAV